MSGAEIALIASIVSASATYEKSKADSRRLKGQAHQANLKGRIDNLNYKRQGIQILKETNKIIAANVAKAAAGNLDPFKSGESPDMISGYSLRMGINDFTIARDNATIAKRMGEYESESLMSAARSTEKIGTMTAIAQVGMGVANYQGIGGPSQTPTTTTSTSTYSPNYYHGSPYYHRRYHASATHGGGT